MMPPLHSCAVCEGRSRQGVKPCPVVGAQMQMREFVERELKRLRLWRGAAWFARLLSDYHAVVGRLADNSGRLGARWPARLALLSIMVIDARVRVENDALGK